MAVTNATSPMSPPLYWTGRALLYFALLATPAMIAQWLGGALPLAMQPIGKIAANAVVLPFLYAALHMMLRRLGARAQNFIYLVVAIFAVVTFMEARRALQLGDSSAWFGAFLAAAYTIGFAVLTIRSLIANRREKRARRIVEEQAGAFARAGQIE